MNKQKPKEKIVLIYDPEFDGQMGRFIGQSIVEAGFTVVNPIVAKNRQEAEGILKAPGNEIDLVISSDNELVNFASQKKGGVKHVLQYAERFTDIPPAPEGVVRLQRASDDYKDTALINYLKGLENQVEETRRQVAKAA